MVMLGSGEYTYEYQVSGLNWGNLPEGRSLGHVLAVAVDSRDRNLHVRGEHVEPRIHSDSGCELCNELVVKFFYFIN